MADYTELKRLAEALISASAAYVVDERNIEKLEEFHAADDALQDALSPEVILALINENERLVAWREGLLKERAAHIHQRDQLKAETVLLDSSRAKLAGELSRLRGKHKDWSADSAMSKNG